MNRNMRRPAASDLPGLLGIPLSPEQLAAATAPLEPGVIVAGAGSGKTTVMAARVVWLVAGGEVSCAGVLGLTFTNKAAAELLYRIRGGLRRLGGPAADAADDALVSTYHSFAGALLREFGPLIGVEPDARLMSGVHQRQVAFGVVAAADLDPLGAAPPQELAGAVLAMDSLLADSGIDAPDLAAFDEELIAGLALRGQQKIGEKMLATARARRQLVAMVEAYRAEKRRREVLDFADYVRLGAAVAGRYGRVGELLRERHQVVLLDEYQDTSVAQRTMLMSLFGGGHPVTAVGDPCQAIYGWRGASPTNMDGFPHHFARRDGSPAPVRTLAANRRSGSAVVALANDVARPLRAVHLDVVPQEPDPRNATGRVVAALLPTVAQEMDWLVGQVRGCGRPWSDIAVLARTNGSAAEAVAALRAAEIPVAVLGRRLLLVLPEVRFLVWALRLAADPSANDATVGLLMSAPWRVGARDMALLAQRAAELAPGAAAARPGEPAADLLAALSGDPLDEPCLLDAVRDPGAPADRAFSPAARERFASFARLVRGWQRRSAGDVADLIRTIAVETGLAVELGLGAISGAPGRPPDDAGLVALVDLARRFDDAERGRSLADFLVWLRLAEEIPEGPQAPPAPTSEAVTVMTVHGSKGLEFPVVVLPGLVEGSFPSDRGRGTWPTSAAAVPPALKSEPAPAAILAFPAAPDQPRASEFTAFSAAVRAAERLEETRLAYVAVTRAREVLVMSGHRWGRSQRRPRQPSEYLKAAAQAAGGPDCGATGVVLDVWALPPDEDAPNPMLEQAAAGHRPGPAAQAFDWTAAAGRLTGTGLPGVPADPALRSAAAGWDRDIAMARAESEARRSPARIEAPADLSVSGWIALARDPGAFALDLARPVPAAAGRAAAAGDAFHAWAASRDGQLALWDSEGLFDTADQPPVAGEELRRAFNESPFGALVPVAVEHPVALRLGGRLVRGRIDAVYRIDGRDWVVDWKTGAAGGADPLQLALYAAAWADESGACRSDIVGCFVYVKHRRYDVYEGLPDLRGAPAAEPGIDAAGGIVPAHRRTWD